MNNNYILVYNPNEKQMFLTTGFYWLMFSDVSLRRSLDTISR